MKHAPKILFVEDEEFLRQQLAELFRRKGYEVFATQSPDEALDYVDASDMIDLVLLDVKLPVAQCKRIGVIESDGGKTAGLIIGQEVRRKFRTIPIIFWTSSIERAVRDTVQEIGDCYLISKGAGPAPVFEIISRAMTGLLTGTRPRCFIVHGHDAETMNQLKEYLVTVLHFPAPVVLKEEPSAGSTILEKIEKYSYDVDLVFVLLTPDDMVVSAKNNTVTHRPRQNVIFELGYFLGLLGRNTGRVIVLFKGNVEIPSDIHGLICIDISKGFDAAHGEISREVSVWLLRRGSND